MNGHDDLFRCLTEEHVNPVERDRTASNNRTGRDRAPENIGAGKLPDGE